MLFAEVASFVKNVVEVVGVGLLFLGRGAKVVRCRPCGDRGCERRVIVNPVDDQAKPRKFYATQEYRRDNCYEW